MSLSNLVYYPAIVCGILNSGWRDFMGLGVDMCWWSERAVFKYDYALISFGLRFYIDVDNVRCFLSMRDSVSLFLDSGGFEIASRQVDISAMSVVAWQVRNASARDVVAVLDVPPVTENLVVSVDMIEKLAMKTARNIRESLPHYEKCDARIFLALHGAFDIVKTVDTWYKIAVKPFLKDADGVAIGPRTSKSSNSSHNIVPVYRYVMSSELADYDIHVFGVGDYLAHILMCIWARKTSRTLSYDSSSYFQSVLNGYYMYLHDGSKISLGSVRGVSKRFINKSAPLPCDCPICRIVNEKLGGVNYFVGTSSSGGKMLPLILHNLYISLFWKRCAEFYSADPELCIRHVEKLGQRAVKSVREMLSDEFSIFSML